LFFRVFAHAALGQLIAEQIKSRKPAEPADRVRREQTSALNEAWAMVKPRNGLPGRRSSMFRMKLRTQANTSFDPYSIETEHSKSRRKKQNLG